MLTFIQAGEFEWDSAKAALNEKKHGVTFAEAMECFLDPHGVDLADPAHPDRIILIAVSRANRILCVVYAERLIALYSASLALAERLGMKRKSTKTTREPSKASLREIPEVDLSRAVVLGRGRHVAKARRSFGSLIVDKSVLKVLGGQMQSLGSCRCWPRQ